MSKSRRPTLLTAVVILLAAGQARLVASPPAPPEFEEAWFVVAMRDSSTGNYQPCGHMHGVLKRVGEEAHSNVTTRLEIKRGGTAMVITMEQSSRETLDGKPLGFRNVQSLGTDPQTIAGTIKGGKVTLVEEQYGAEKKGVYPFDPEIKFAWGQTLMQRARGLEPGTTFTLKTYEPSLRKDGPLELAFKVHGPESVDVLGKKQKLHRVTTSMKLDSIPIPGGAPAGGGQQPPGGGLQIDSDIWVDDDANPVITTVDLGFMQLKMYKTTKEDALQRGAPPEMFLDTLVRVKKKIGPEAKSVKLRLRMKEGVKAEMPTLPNTSAQSFERVNEREAVVTIRRVDWEKFRKVKDNAPDTEELRPFLSASSVCDAKDAKIRRLARKAVRGCKTPADKADALRKFVTDYITDKNMDVGFATASEVARRRSGDCSEHGVLLAALARAAGLPARGVSGIVEIPPGSLMAQGENAFGYHMWAQVYIGGQWVDLDAALRQTECDATRIAVSLMPLGEEGLMNSVVALIPLLGQLEIEVLEVK